MATTPRILAFAGSTRTESFNKRLIKIAVAGAQAAGAEVTLIDLGIAGDSIHHSWAQFGRYLLKSPDISNTRCDQAADCSATSLRCTGSCHMRTQLHCQRAN